ncbi:MAG: hypothetical protein IH586_21720, partial [Anaerolineaceae bacterium]|nr:hypothetical protein [Anaerolineaceae bacterium]
MTKRTPGFLVYVLPGLGDILWMGAFFGAIGLGPRMMNVDGDLGRHLAVGGYILDEGKVPLQDLFSHTLTGQVLTPHEWLAQVVFALSARLAGLNGVVLTCALLIAFTFWLVFRRARQASQGLLLPVLAVVLAMAASSLHWLTRPHLFTFLMLALWMNVLEDLRSGKLRRWWLLPILMLVWANLHGAFIAGFVTWGVYGIGLAWDAFWRRFPKGEGLHGHFWRYYLLAGALAFLVTLVNPSGINLWGTSVGYVGNRYLVSHTMEYLPPDFHDPSTWPFLIYIALLIFSSGMRSKRVEAGQLFLAIAWLVMGLYSVRNVPLFVILSAPLLAAGLQDWLHTSQHRGKMMARLHNLDLRMLNIDLSLRGLLWPVLCLAIAIAGFRAGVPLDFQQQGNRFDAQVFPVDAANWLVEHPQPGEMFNYFPWGGYLLYRSWPQQRVFIDGQTDFYGEPFTRQYEQVISVSPGWQDVLT